MRIPSPLFAARIHALEPLLARLHASPWAGVLEEVGCGGWIQTLLQTVPGASNTLLAGYCSYSREAQQTRYGTPGRSVARASVEAWARHNLPPGPQRFSLALSGSARTGEGPGDAHAWLALALPQGDGWSLHLRLKHTDRLAQQWAVGELGVRLLAQLATHAGLQIETLSLPDGIEIDLWQPWQQPARESYSQMIALLEQQAAPLLLFEPVEGHLQPVRPLERLRGRKLLLHKGSFNPVTRAHLAMPARVLACEPDWLPVLEISLSNFDKDPAGRHELCHRLAMLAFQPWPVALTQTPALYATAELFRAQGQAAAVDFVCGADLASRVFEPRYYRQLAGGIDEGLQRLFAAQTRLWVCGRDLACARSAEGLAYEQHWRERLRPLPLDLPVASSAIRARIAADETGWEADLPPEVADYIHCQGLYRQST